MSLHRGTFFRTQHPPHTCSTTVLPISNSSPSISSSNVLTNMHFCLSHLEPPRDTHWSRLMLAGLFDWSLAACVSSLCDHWNVCARAPSPCCGQDVMVRVEGACCKVTRPHTYTAVPWGILRSAAVFSHFLGCEETLQRLDVGFCCEEGKGERQVWKHWHRYEGRHCLAKDGKLNRSFAESKFV